MPVRLIPAGDTSASYLQAAADAANDALKATTIPARYSVGDRTIDVTNVEVQFITNKSFFAEKGMPQMSETIAFIDTDVAGTEVVSARVYINLTATVPCGGKQCLDPNGANFDLAVSNLISHEAMGHLFGLDDTDDKTSLMGPFSGKVNDIVTIRGPNGCDMGALQARVNSTQNGTTACALPGVTK